MYSVNDKGLQSTLANMLTTLPQKVEPSHTVLIVVDVQNDYCASDGAFHRDGMDLSMVQDMIPRLVDFIDKARKVGISIVYIQSYYFAEGNPYLTSFGVTFTGALYDESILVGTSHGVLESVDHGVTWAETNMPNVQIRDIDTFRAIATVASHGRNPSRVRGLCTSAVVKVS